MEPNDVLDDRYQLIELLGQGGFGMVWRAFDVRVRRQVAVKVMLTGGGDAKKDRDRFAREASIAGNLNHPHIVTVYDFGETQHAGLPMVYLVMELLTGQSLSSVLKRGLPPLPQALSWAGQICDALGAAHAVGVVHRDVKPDNIMIQVSGTVKVVDFGIAKAAERQTVITTTANAVIGTIAYMAPERFSGIADSRADLYALGCMLTELCTGRRPFEGNMWDLIRQHGQEAPPLPSHFHPGLPESLDRLVMDLLAKDPDQRPPTAGHVKERLQDISQHRTQPYPSHTPTVDDHVATPPSGKESQIPLQGTFLRRGDTVSLTEKVPNLTAVTIRFGWDLRGTDGDFDLDASAIMVDSKGMVLSSEHFVFFNNLRSPEGSVVHSGDFPTGEDEAYDNAIKVNLAAVPGAVEKIVLPVSVYDAESRMQTFRQVKRAFIRIVDPSNNLEVASYDLADDAASPYTALVFGELYRRRRGWDFRGGGKGYTSGLWGVARDHGVNV